VDLSVTLLEHKLPHPILLAPIACLQLVHPDGEIAAARAARAARAGMVLSSYTTIAVERVAT
jgi:isopentenyl diphosphate isomerase/L-lactate dehydrogenase-like FMN-dependent dehydrogenase